MQARAIFPFCGDGMGAGRALGEVAVETNERSRPQAMTKRTSQCTQFKLTENTLRKIAQKVVDYIRLKPCRV
jgi:hypothetical protein